jgi:hypothetical protein
MDYWLADCAYGSYVILEQAKDQSMNIIIPPKQNRILALS